MSEIKTKKNYYQLCQPINDEAYLCSNFYAKTYLVINSNIYGLYNQGQFKELKELFPQVYLRLLEGGFLVDENVDETVDIVKEREEERQSTELFHLIINPTLDCNLSCWYCYENKIPKSNMSDEVITGICRLIVNKYNEEPYKTLKLSFFGGEPFMRYNTISRIITFADSFCKEHGVFLLLDFTTNGSIITKTALRFLKEYRCMFQITLDGNREQHNKIKHTNNFLFDAFSATCNNIRNIQKEIQKSSVSVRLNFDSETLDGFDDILKEIIDLDRKRTKIILKKVWQVDSSKINNDKILSVIEKLFENGFIVDYYSQGGICFADKKNEAVINYDGNVFKCTTISHFDEQESFGYLDCNSGKIVWNIEKIKPLEKVESPSQCVKCAMFPSCGGPCRRKNSPSSGWNCFLSTIGMTKEEYALLQFQIELIKDKVYEK